MMTGGERLDQEMPVDVGVDAAGEPAELCAQLRQGDADLSVGDRHILEVEHMAREARARTERRALVPPRGGPVELSTDEAPISAHVCRSALGTADLRTQAPEEAEEHSEREPDDDEQSALALVVGHYGEGTPRRLDLRALDEPPAKRGRRLTCRTPR